jgi:murein endopeptidase
MKRSVSARRRRAWLFGVVTVAACSAVVAGAMLAADEQGMAEDRAAGSPANDRTAGRVADVPRRSLTSDEPARERGRNRPPIEWRESTAIGTPSAGRLEDGVKVPSAGAGFFTWDPIQRESPNRGWRRWGTDRLVRTTLRVVREFARAHPNAPRIGIGDLSRPHGGDFGPRYGLPGHASHQNGLDVDLYYPRLDRKELSPKTVEQIDLSLSQDLVDRFVDAGAEVVFVGPNTGLDGSPGVVVPLVNHDNHVHVRLPD